ncbi:hypothetical protein FYZ48_28690 [Gimesia chilikensis]|uniref:hypothetical protein n=1 Tax=Gimesia chilikensis TaxID=2605989 RepID=UPI0011ED15AF|nr:hypothetical protein [Gimesia chilikensis]KAA0132094.1 hypothetical protein FYZ48_28690 [Gimesia chilikensis]
MNESKTTKYDETVNWFKNHRLFCIIIFVGLLVILFGQVSKSVLDIKSFCVEVQTFFDDLEENKPPSEWSKQLQSYGNYLPGNVHILPGTDRVVIDKHKAISFYQNMNLQDDTHLDKLRNSILEKLKNLIPIYSNNKTFHMLPDKLLQDMRTLFNGVKEHAEANP